MKSLRMFLALSVLTGILYPYLLPLLGQIAFLHKLRGEDQCRGKGGRSGIDRTKNFTSPKHFWGRPSAVDYNPLPREAVTWAHKPLLRDAVQERLK